MPIRRKKIVPLSPSHVALCLGATNRRTYQGKQGASSVSLMRCGDLAGIQSQWYGPHHHRLGKPVWSEREKALPDHALEPLAAFRRGTAEVHLIRPQSPPTTISPTFHRSHPTTCFHRTPSLEWLCAAGTIAWPRLVDSNRGRPFGVGFPRIGAVREAPRECVAALYGSSLRLFPNRTSRLYRSHAG